MNEQSLLAAAKSRGTATLDALYRAHADKLFCTIHRITRNHEDAEDAVQDAFLSAFRHLGSFDGRSTFSTWLTRIGINAALMILRKKHNSREVSAHSDGENDMAWELPDSGLDPEKRYGEEERARLVRDAIADLRPSIRRPLQLYTLQGHSLERIAREIGTSLSAAKARLFHGKAALRKSKVLRNISDRQWRRHVFESGESTVIIREGSKKLESETNLVVKHGAWADGPYRSRVIPRLRKKGLNAQFERRSS